MNIAEQLMEQGKAAQQAARFLATVPTGVKNEALHRMAASLINRQEEILNANQRDMGQARERGQGKAFLDRLLLTPERLEEMADGLRTVAALPDPVGEVTGMWTRPNGLQIGRVRVPLGVVGIIYESRPNVTVDAAGLCLKTGNAVLLRGGSESFRSNQALTRVIGHAATEAGLPAAAIQLVQTTSREAVQVMLRLNRYLDVLIPRGGADLIQNVVETSTVPVIETGVGNCHVYIDEFADLEMASSIVINAKTQRPGVCNAMETLLVHGRVAAEFLPRLSEKLVALGVELRGCPETLKILPGAKPATEEDWATEYLDLILAIRIVDGLEEALEHISAYGTRHSEAIVTENYSRARKFLQAVDAAAVYVNASTRFTDGFQFGFGSEIGISTQKLHARGPMGLEALTTIKYIVYGNGQVRS